LTKIENNYFWDSCVFIRYLTGSLGDKYFADICQHIDDVKAGKTQIHYSTIAFAEIKPSHLHIRDYGSIGAFFDDFQSAFSPIGPTPDILIRAGAIRDMLYSSPDGGKDRPVGTADAIHLMTCLYARDVLGIRDIVFQTLDEGKNGNHEGKCVPLVTYEKWTVGLPKNQLVTDICNLARDFPVHPQAGLFAGNGTG
jgi:hypothetical protein